MAVSEQLAVSSVVIEPTAVTNGAAAVTGVLDTNGAHYAEFEIVIGQESATNAEGCTLALTESSDATNYSTFDANFARSAEQSTAAGGKVVRYMVDCRKRSRYLKISVTPGTETGDDYTIACVGRLSRRLFDASASTDWADVCVIG